MSIEKVIVSRPRQSNRGRDRFARSLDNVLYLKLTVRARWGGAGGAGTNPSSCSQPATQPCFLGALKYVAGQQKVILPACDSIEGSVGIRPDPYGFGIEVE